MMMDDIMCDGWWMNVVMNELRGVYSGLVDDEGSRVGDLGLEYGEYRMWEGEVLEGRLLDRELEYWKNKVKGGEVVELGMDGGK
ncbi:hypothetical protein, partial [Paenibacillus xylanexedens]|uniref:hypothetical protein n=1 Tax=Paenibacillus xylanexedens TaxID=528191 RepID=UPI0011A3E010